MTIVKNITTGKLELIDVTGDHAIYGAMLNNHPRYELTASDESDALYYDCTEIVISLNQDDVDWYNEYVACETATGREKADIISHVDDELEQVFMLGLCDCYGDYPCDRTRALSYMQDFAKSHNLDIEFDLEHNGAIL
jgi:hypothetical protein